RTDRRAGLVVVEPDALGALLGHDVEDLVRDRGPLRPVERIPLDAALVDRRVRALGLAGAAVDALVGDHRGHAGRVSGGCMRAQSRTVACWASSSRSACGPPEPCVGRFGKGLARGEEVRPDLFHESRWGRVIVRLARQSLTRPDTRLRLRWRRLGVWAVT